MHTLAAITAADGDGVDLSDLDAEQFFNCLGDVDLGGIGSDLEGVLLIGNTSHGVLGDDGGENDVPVRTSSRIYLLKFLGGVQAEDQLVGVDNVVGVDAGSGSLDTGDVGGALDELDIRVSLRIRFFLPAPTAARKANNGLGLVLVGGDLVDDDQVAVGSLVRQGAEQSQALDLLVDGVRVITRLGAESNTTVGPLRSADRTPDVRGRCPSGAKAFCRRRGLPLRILVFWVPWRWLARKLTTASWTAFSFGGDPEHGVRKAQRWKLSCRSYQRHQI